MPNAIKVGNEILVNTTTAGPQDDPAIAALGVVLFRKVDDAMFRHAVLAVLFVAGLALVV